MIERSPYNGPEKVRHTWCFNLAMNSARGRCRGDEVQNLLTQETLCCVV